jgi:hypothetical protein
MDQSRQRTTDVPIPSGALIPEGVIETHPALRLRRTCGTRDHRWSVTPAGAEARDERLCSVCAAQLGALGYTVELHS